MPSNSEMYELGAVDAENDDLNTFYYQHYYYYRRGYNDARRQLRGGPLSRLAPWLVSLAVVAALAGAGLLAFWYLSPQSQADVAPASPSQVSAAPSAPTLPRLTATPTQAASPTPAPALRIGGRARVVNLGDSTLRARAEPGLAPAIRIVARFPQGSEVGVAEGPVDADGLTWWRIQGEAGEGWSAERSPEGVVFLEPLP